MLSARAWLRKGGVSALLVVLLLVAAELWLAFNAGGFFAGTTGVATVAVGLVFVGWIMVAPRPFASLGPALTVGAMAIVLLAMWALYSQRWSHAAARATIEFDRTLLYALVALTAGLVATTDARRRALLIAVWSSMAIVCGSGLITRLLPELWSPSETIRPEQLSYPVSYWNTLGLIGVIALVASLHIASSVRERLWLRSIACAATPLLFSTVLLTFSRGSIAMVAVAILAYIGLARPRGAIAALGAAIPACAAAGIATYTSDAVVDGPGARDLVDQGQSVALVIAGCMLLATALLLILRPMIEARIREQHTRRFRRKHTVLATVAVTVALFGTAMAAGVPVWLGDQANAFTSTHAVEGTPGDARSRLTDVGNNGRIEQWRVSLDAFRADPVRGTGAGTFTETWTERRPSNFDVNDGHSLVLETLSELGIVGAGLIVLALTAMLAAGARRIRGPNRALHAALFVIVLIWAIRAQVDWDWEMPALTAPVMACGGTMLAARTTSGGGRSWPPPLVRLVAAILVLVVLWTPLGVARSQSSLDASVAELRAGRCDRAIAQALSSIDAMSSRPEPFQVLAFCDLRLGRSDLALAASRAAVRRDPSAWQSQYYLAVARAASGLDPRPRLRAAQRLNPLSELVKEASVRFGTSDPSRWRKQALSARLPL